VAHREAGQRTQNNSYPHGKVIKMAKMVYSLVAGDVQSLIEAQDYEFANIGAPSNPETLLKIVKTAGSIVTVLGYYYWGGAGWVAIGASLPVSAIFNPAAVAITGGSVNNTPIGAATPNTGAFSTLSATGAMSQLFSGLVRTLTPIGGAFIREWADMTANVINTSAAQGAAGVAFNVAVNTAGIYVGMNVTGNANIPAGAYVASYVPATGVVTLSAATTAALPITTPITFTPAFGSTEYGITYNYNILTGVRDVLDVCWVSKWNDAAGLQEIWSAVSGAAGSIPAWTQVYSFDSINGALSIPGKFTVSSAGIQNFSKSVIATAALVAATLTTANTFFTGAAGAAFALTLPAAAIGIDGLTVTVMSTVARPVTTWTSAGGSIVGAPAALVGNTPVNLQYDHASLSWYIC
jgi:hypothetical protein